MGQLKNLCRAYANAILTMVYEGDDCQYRRHHAICEHIIDELNVRGQLKKSEYLHDFSKNINDRVNFPFWFMPIGFDEDEALNEKKLIWLTNQYYGQFKKISKLLSNIVTYQRN